MNRYPDFLVMTTNAILLAVGTKGDYLDNVDSKIKVRSSMARTDR